MTTVAKTSAPPTPGGLRAWILASRPKTLAAAFVPVAVGTAVAYLEGGLDWGPALAALGGASALQIGTNYANDVFDFEKGADTEDRVGPMRAAQSGLISPRALYTGMILAFVIATLFGVYLTVHSGWVIIAIGVVSILSGIAYTGGPFPLGYHGLGDVFVMVFFGFVAVAGTVFVQLGHIPPITWVVALPVGAMATNILVVNNVRDRHTDVRVGKRTLAVRFGKRAGLIQFSTLLILSYAVPLALCYWLGSLWPTLVLLTVPLALRVRRELSDREGKTLNDTLASSAKLMTFFGVLFALGLALA